MNQGMNVGSAAGGGLFSNSNSKENETKAKATATSSQGQPSTVSNTNSHGNNFNQRLSDLPHAEKNCGEFNQMRSAAVHRSIVETGRGGKKQRKKK